jgi:Pyridoxamine 5'-phosphate oxidase
MTRDGVLEYMQSCRRKMRNLRADPRIALVLGWDECTVQLDGVADEPTGADLSRLQALYLARFPDGRERQRWAGLTYVRARPTWIRYSDFRCDPPENVEFQLTTAAGHG